MGKIIRGFKRIVGIVGILLTLVLTGYLFWQFLSQLLFPALSSIYIWVVKPLIILIIPHILSITLSLISFLGLCYWIGSKEEG